jgi:hypothetical protein
MRLLRALRIHDATGAFDMKNALADHWHIEGRKSKGHGSAYEPWGLLDRIKAPAIYVFWRGIS